MPALLLGITMTYWGLTLLNVMTLNTTILGLLALITGILYIASCFIALPAVPVHRRTE